MSKWLLISLALLFASGSTRGDDAAAAQRDLIDAQIAHFPAETGSEAHVYFLGFAGYGEERVFAEEIKLAAKIVGEKYGSASRSVLLLNDRRDLSTYPLASESSLRYSLNALGRVMNRDEDVLFLALSSHGSRGATIEVSNEGMEPRTLGAVTLADLLAESGIRWKVIVVSACFSGAFVEPLADNHTIILTAASRSRTSFGCSDQRDLTYFGEAFYRDSLPGSTQLRAAFETAKQEIRRREKEEGVRASQPQSYFGPLMEEKLRGIEQTRQAE
ncbi:MAG TPA: C13 family peptidase [Steroidobacteraceae bacterium]|nr:C13 family peptidase [Steroidobacteraceae bacterium]